MAGGVSPYEWIMPAVGGSHLLYNAVAQQVSPRAKVDTPTSKNDVRDTQNEEERNRETLGRAAAADAAAKYLANNPPSQTAQDELAARRRAEAAGIGRSGERRASRYLASSERTLGAA